MKKEFLIIKTTYPDINNAKKLAEILLIKKFATCVQFSKIESMFVWQKKSIKRTNSSKDIISCEKEILVSIKTKANFYKKIEREILNNHPYQVPQIISIRIDGGFKNYLDWIGALNQS